MCFLSNLCLHKSQLSLQWFNHQKVRERLQKRASNYSSQEFLALPGLPRSPKCLELSAVAVMGTEFALAERGRQHWLISEGSVVRIQIPLNDTAGK